MQSAKILGIIVVSGLLALSMVFQTAPQTLAQAPTPTSQNKVFLPVVVTFKPTPTPSASSKATEVVQLVNAERAKVGCPPVTMNDQLNAAAYNHSQDMAHNDYFSHTSLDGSRFTDRLKAEGYNYATGGENIAAGYSSPQGVMAGWMGSSGHRANILNCGYQEIGVGYYYLANDTGSINYRHYWTQDFGTPR